MEKVLAELAVKIPELLLLGGLFFFITKWQLRLIQEQQQVQREQSKTLDADYDRIGEKYNDIIQRLIRIETLYDELKKDSLSCQNRTQFLKGKVEDILFKLGMTGRRDDTKP